MEESKKERAESLVDEFIDKFVIWGVIFDIDFIKKEKAEFSRILKELKDLDILKDAPDLGSSEFKNYVQDKIEELYNEYHIETERKYDDESAKLENILCSITLDEVTQARYFYKNIVAPYKFSDVDLKENDEEKPIEGICVVCENIYDKNEIIGLTESGLGVCEDCSEEHTNYWVKNNIE